MSDKNLIAALEYAKKGYKVFPCAINGKIPLTKNGFKDASMDIATVEKMFTEHPQANIGLVTGTASVDIGISMQILLDYSFEVRAQIFRGDLVDFACPAVFYL